MFIQINKRQNELLMKNTITIPVEQYECLREHLAKALEMFKSLEAITGSVSTSRVASNKDKRRQRIDKYKEHITNGTKPKKSDILK